MEISQTVFKLWGGHNFITKITIYNVQKAKIGPQLWFLCFACCLMVVNISVKVCENISNGFQVKGQTGFCDG